MKDMEYFGEGGLVGVGIYPFLNVKYESPILFKTYVVTSIFRKSSLI